MEVAKTFQYAHASKARRHSQDFFPLIQTSSNETTPLLAQTNHAAAATTTSF